MEELSYTCRTCGNYITPEHGGIGCKCGAIYCCDPDCIDIEGDDYSQSHGIKSCPECKGQTMKLTGIDVLKMLPKTNCKECGAPSCLAFGMQVASQQKSIKECPYVRETIREIVLNKIFSEDKGIELIMHGKGDEDAFNH